MDCSIGQYIEEDCHKPTYNPVKKILRRFDDLSENEKQLLQRRLPELCFETVCLFHKKVFLNRYHHIYGKSCCDPLEVHTQKSPKKNTLNHS